MSASNSTTIVNLTNAYQDVKAAAGTVWAITVTNAGTAQFLQISGLSTDTLGTTAALWTCHIPASTTLHLMFPRGLRIGSPGVANGRIRIAATTSSSNAVAPAAVPTSVTVTYS